MSSEMAVSMDIQEWHHHPDLLSTGTLDGASVPFPALAHRRAQYESMDRVQDQRRSWQGRASVKQPASGDPKQMRLREDIHHQSSWPRQASAAQYRVPNPQQPHRTRLRPPGDVMTQAGLLNELCYRVVEQSEVRRDQIARKEAFRQTIEKICQQTIKGHEDATNATAQFPSTSVRLQCFGSLASGFATNESDMDLGLFSPMSTLEPDAVGSPIPRLVEKALLFEGYGVRLLNRTRVPIIKLCEQPTADLRVALLAERSKWEKSIEIDATKRFGDEREDVEAQSELPDSNARGRSTLKSVQGGELEMPLKDYSEIGPSTTLRQAPGRSLITYYNAMRKALRETGGRDVTPDNIDEFSPHDWITLKHFCQSFVVGLHDPELRRRLDSYPSLSWVSSDAASCNRSLAGVFVQAEGERIILEWENLAEGVRSLSTTKHIEKTIEAWRQLQRQSVLETELLSYDKNLEFTFGKLKHHAFIKLMQLTQHPQETAAQYCSRTQRIMSEFQDIEASSSDLISEYAAAQYVRGIRDDAIRTALGSIIIPSGAGLSLAEAGQRHKCLQLAYEFERAMDNGVYGPDCISDITEYIQILKSSPQRIRSQHEESYVIPVRKEALQVLSRIRKLPDPGRLSTGQSQANHKVSLEFPSCGVGVQCDINFAAHLALQNTALLRCYSLTDPRVRPMVLFIKAWAKARGINSGYRGTLSSYGFVLMVLHYLVNIASPFVCPNIQHLTPHSFEDQKVVDMQQDLRYSGYNLHFWRDEEAIARLAAGRQLTYNTETIGFLLRGFFEYFAHNGPLSRGFGKGFDWGREVISLRSPGGILSKRAKGWTSARTVVEQSEAATTTKTNQSQPEAYKEVKNRYLLAIEDPFELDHNIARTVTHNGIVSVRDEFRRAWRIIQSSGSAGWAEPLLTEITRTRTSDELSEELLEEIHGPQQLWAAQ